MSLRDIFLEDLDLHFDTVNYWALPATVTPSGGGADFPIVVIQNYDGDFEIEESGQFDKAIFEIRLDQYIPAPTFYDKILVDGVLWIVRQIPNSGGRAGLTKELFCTNKERVVF